MDHVERLIAQWRHGAIVAGQFSIEGEDGTDQQIAAGQAMALCECADELEALLAERPPPQEAPAWQSMETAPTDGTHVVLFGTLWNDPAQRPRACVSWYCRNRHDSPAHALGWFYSAPGYTNGFNPTHWASEPLGSPKP